MLQTTVCMLRVMATARCARTGPATSVESESTLRVGIAQLPTSSATNGAAAIVQVLSGEGLARIGEDGRPIPSLAESWGMADDGLSLTVHLRPGVMFHDGTPVNPGQA